MEKLETLFAEFDTTLDKTIAAAWSADQLTVHLQKLEEGIEIIAEKIRIIGDHSRATLEAAKDNHNPELLPHYLLNFVWPEQAKAYLILCRNILFEQLKAQVLSLDGGVSEAQLNDLNAQSQATLLAATDEFKNFPTDASATILATKKGPQKQIAKWRLQENPWPTYREQILQLPKQARQLSQQHQLLQDTSGHFKHIREFIQKMVDASQAEIHTVETVVEKTLNFIAENIEEKPGKIAVYLEDLDEVTENPNHLNVFSEQLEKKLDTIIEKILVPVATNGGLIQHKEINLQRSTRQWLESEILPLLYEVWELTENGINGLKMSLMNIRNRSILLAAEGTEKAKAGFDKKALSQPLESFLTKTKTWQTDLSELEKMLNYRLENAFRLSEIYNTQRNFLPVPLQSTINKFKLDQNKLLVSTQKWFKEKVRVVERFKAAVEREEELSISEKIVRFVQTRQCNADNQQYNSIFQTKGYIGESFWVGRKNELQHIESLIGQWKNGFRGAVLLSGQRFSGKTLFGELVASRFFYNNTIRLAPNSSIDIHGRKFNTGYNLEEALEFIRKYTLNIQPLVWIDNIELWADPAFPLNQNIRKLNEHIDDYSGQIFYLVSTSNWLKAHLEKIHDLDHIFQAEINLDRMSADEIRQAILIRHGATHKALVNEQMEEVTPQQFNKMTAKIYRTAEGNVGEALNLWSVATRRVDDDNVTHAPLPGYGLPDFADPDNALLLETLMIVRRTNEYRLRKLFGTPFSEKYGSVLQRLIRLGLLNRQMDGWLEVNESVANDVGRLLDRKKYLKFYR